MNVAFQVHRTNTIDRILQHEESSGAAVPAMDEEESVPYVIPLRGRLIRLSGGEVYGL